MELRAATLDVIASLPKDDLLCLSYPKINLPAEAVKEAFPVTQANPDGSVDAQDLFKAMGAKNIRFINHEREHALEGLVNLNGVVDIEQADLVIDPGVTANCFNVGQALMNVAGAVKRGGHVVHCLPVSRVNYAFWNFSPRVLWDFYSQNGWGVALWFEKDEELFECPATKPIRISPGTSIVCIAKRNTDSVLYFPSRPPDADAIVILR